MPTRTKTCWSGKHGITGDRKTRFALNGWVSAYVAKAPERPFARNATEAWELEGLIFASTLPVGVHYSDVLTFRNALDDLHFELARDEPMTLFTKTSTDRYKLPRPTD